MILLKKEFSRTFVKDLDFRKLDALYELAHARVQIMREPKRCVRARWMQLTVAKIRQPVRSYYYARAEEDFAKVDEQLHYSSNNIFQLSIISLFVPTFEAQNYYIIRIKEEIFKYIQQTPIRSLLIFIPISRN